MKYAPGSISARVAEAIKAGKTLPELKKELKLTNDFTYYKVRRDLGLAKPRRKAVEGVTQKVTQKYPKKKGAAGIIRVEAIFHGVDGEVLRLLSSPQEFLNHYHRIIG